MRCYHEAFALYDFECTLLFLKALCAKRVARTQRRAFTSNVKEWGHILVLGSSQLRWSYDASGTCSQSDPMFRMAMTISPQFRMQLPSG